MSDLIRDAPFGQIVRWITKNKYFQYPEEKAGFELPQTYLTALNSEKAIEIQRPSTPHSTHSSQTANTASRPPLGERNPSDLEKQPTHRSEDLESGSESTSTVASLQLQRTKSRSETAPYTEERLETEEVLAIERHVSRPIVPTKTADGMILVEWYTTDDPANPQNWSNGKRGLISFLICAYTFVVYTGSAIYTTSEGGVIEKFGVNNTAVSLPLALYVLAYGLGPLIFAPLSEVAVIGRSPIYIITFALFVIISLPTALVDNFAGLLVLRFLQGFFGSPCLANGAATMQDMYSLLYLPFALVAWVSAAYCGPALGPLLSGFAVTAEGWRWSLWEILWASGPVLILMFLLLPETSTPNLLLRRAARLRKLTGDERLRAQSEIDQKHLKPSAILVDALIKPLEITIKDPAIAFVNIYTAIVYGIYYSFFEVFPLVYTPFYGFTIGTIGVLFTSILVACGFGIVAYIAYLKFYLIPDILKNGLRAQEHRLVPALIACFGPTIGLFLFGWTARESIHWIVPTIGIVIYAASVFVLMQCIFVYVPLSYPQYAASLFAGNDFFRSAFACASILFARPLFINLGIAKGVTLLAGLSTLGIIGIYLLYIFGAKLRSRSKFAVA